MIMRMRGALFEQLNRNTNARAHPSQPRLQYRILVLFLPKASTPLLAHGSTARVLSACRRGNLVVIRSFYLAINQAQ